MQRPNLESFAACMIMIHHRSVLVDPKGCGLSDILSLSLCLCLSLSLSHSACSIYCTLFSTQGCMTITTQYKLSAQIHSAGHVCPSAIRD
ncbi:hypothetical protein V8C43DRAFT_277432 [Trichoderma afarasin]